MDVIRGPYYNLNYRILSITGQWPYLTKSQKWIRRTFSVIIFLTLLVPMWLGLFKEVGDINSAIECISPLVIITGGFIIFLNFIVISEALKALLETIEKDWITWSKEPEIDILEKYAKEGKQFRMTYAVTLLGILAGFLALPGLPTFLDWVKPLNESRPRSPIYLADYGVDCEEYYNLIFFHSYFFSFFPVLMLINGDMIFMACAQHCCGIFAAMGFLQQIHYCFSFTLLLTVILNMMIISVTGVQTIVNLDHPQLAVRFGSSTIAQMIHLFCLTIPCQRMMDHSMNISDSVYKSNWYLLPSQTQKLLQMIMRRSSEPFEFLVGKMYIYSMKNFAMVIKTSISYFTVLTSVQ